MQEKSLLSRVASGLVILSLGLLVSGTDACQEDYDFASQTTVTPGAEVPSTATIAATTTVTGTVTPATSQTPTPVSTATAPTDEEAQGDPSLFSELSSLSRDGDDVAAAPGGKIAQSGNWLGRAFSKEGSDSWQDSDGDGFSDAFEDEHDTDPSDSRSVPIDVLSTRYGARLQSADQDLDGLTMEEEVQKGTNPSVADTDQDGRIDGAEVASGGDPLLAQDVYSDGDGDGLGDEFEKAQGLNPSNIDSDSDGLRDDREMVVGSNPLSVDTDSDGISDGKEIDLGSDPVAAELRN